MGKTIVKVAKTEPRKRLIKHEFGMGKWANRFRLPVPRYYRLKRSRDGTLEIVESYEGIPLNEEMLGIIMDRFLEALRRFYGVVKIGDGKWMGFVHGDLHPSNIVMKKRNGSLDVKLIDLELAERIEGSLEEVRKRQLKDFEFLLRRIEDPVLRVLLEEGFREVVLRNRQIIA